MNKVFEMRVPLFLSAALFFVGAAPVVAERFDCVISPAVTVRVGTPVPGLLDEVLVDQGDRLVRGQKIAALHSEVESKTLELLAVQARSTAEIEAQESRLSLSKKRLERVRDLVEREVATQEQLEAVEAETEVIIRERAIAEMRRQVMLLELERAEAQIERRTIRSPLDGVVVARHLFGGEFFATEDSVVTIAKVDPLHVVAFLPVSLYRSIKVNGTYSVFPEPPVEGEYPAKISVIDSVFDAASGTFGIRLELANPDGHIPAGHRCQVEINID